MPNAGPTTALPKSVKVGPHDYKVIKDAEVMAAVGGAGATQNDMLSIIIDPINAPSIQAETVLHEILHCVWFQTGLSKKYDDGPPDSDGEDIINRLSPVLLQVLRDNPKLINYLRESK